MAILARRRHTEPDIPRPVWLVTFSDMMALLLTFFVMLVSYASFDPVSARDVVLSIKGALGVSRIEGGIPGPSQTAPPATLQRANLAREASRIQQQLWNKGLTGRMRVQRDREGITLVMLDPLLFPADSAQLTEEQFSLLDALAEVVNGYTNPVRIEGYTDASPLAADAPFHDLWELAGARAHAVLAYLIERGEVRTDRLSYSGLGPNLPVATGPAGATANHRVEVKLIATEPPDTVFWNFFRHQTNVPDNTEIR